MGFGEASATLQGTHHTGVALNRRKNRTATKWKQSHRWRRWFAWRPVVFETRTGRWRVVWLQYLERRWSEGITSGLGPRWVYRRTQSKQ